MGPRATCALGTGTRCIDRDIADRCDSCPYGGGSHYQAEAREARDRRTNYQRGADFERKVRDHLMFDLDATYVVRSAGSRGIADLVAFFQGIDSEYDNGPAVFPQVWLVQVKRDGKITPEDLELLRSLAAETGCDAWLAMPEANGRRVDVKMVEVTDGVDTFTAVERE